MSDKHETTVERFYVVSESELVSLQRAAILCAIKRLSVEERTHRFQERAKAEAACRARPVEKALPYEDGCDDCEKLWLEMTHGP